MKIEIIAILVSIIGILVSFYTFIKNYNEIKRKNNIDIMPIFDIDIFNTQVNIDLYIKKFNYGIALFNFGNGIAKNIVLKNNSEEGSFIGNIFTVAKSFNYYNILGDIEKIIDRDKKIKFIVEYEDFNNKKYSQEFELKIRMSKNYLNFTLLGRINYYNNGNLYYPQQPTEYIYSYFLDKKVSIPVEIK